MRLKINITNLTETCVTSYVIILHVFSYKVHLVIRCTNNILTYI